MRGAIRSVHRWTGVIAGLWLTLVAISGIGMVFSTSFYGWEFGDSAVSVAMRDAPYVGPDVWLAKAEARYGKLASVEGFFGPRATPMRISAPTIVYTPPGTHKHGIVTVDPYSGEPLAHFIADDSWSFVPLWLHLSLFLPEEAASWATVILAVLLFGFGVSGLYLWWPGRGRLRAAAAIPNPRSPVSLRRFHAAIGFWASPLLILAAFTGLLLARGDVQEAVTAPFGQSAEFDPVAVPPGRCLPRAAVSAGDALAVARERFPGRELGALFLPFEGNDVYTVWMRPADGTVPARGDAEAIVDAKCGTLLFARTPEAMRSGDVIQTYLVELHNGRVLGLFGEGVIILQGLALFVLPIAGLILFWWRRRRRLAAQLSPLATVPTRSAAE
ncbi:MAG: PepSY-associated TM helix domain-containing protein [Sphingomonadaceae bacterium]